jgi:hypothetical protein
MSTAHAALALFAVIGSAAVAPAQLIARPIAKKPIETSSVPAGLETLDAPFKADVLAVATKPLITAKAKEESFTANPTVYQWLLDHPDRAALAWERLGIPCLPIRDTGKGQFLFKDDQGNEVIWQQVGTLTDGRVWYATGKVKPGALVPTVPVKAVATLRHPQAANGDGTISLTPAIHVYFQTDSRAASTVMRIAGPAAPRMAEDGAEQLLFFFSGLAKYLHKHPDQVTALLSPPKTAATKRP